MTYTASGILRSTPVRMLEQRVEDSSNSKQGLDGVGGILARSLQDCDPFNR